MLSTERQRFLYDLRWLFKIKYPFRCAFLLWLCWDEFLDSIEEIVSFCINLEGISHHGCGLVAADGWVAHSRTIGTLDSSEGRKCRRRIRYILAIATVFEVPSREVVCLEGLNFVEVEPTEISR